VALTTRPYSAEVVYGLSYTYTFLYCLHRSLLGDLTFLMGHTVAQLVEALRYKPEGFGFFY